MTSRIIVDASPLIILIKSDLAYLLPNLFDKVVVPDAVWQEVLAGDGDDVARNELPSFAWAVRVPITAKNVSVERFDLGRGEIETITLALEFPNSKVLIDDAAARICAKSFNIPFVGTGGLLILAKRRGLITSFSEALSMVQSVGMWIGDDIVSLLKQTAAE